MTGNGSAPAHDVRLLHDRRVPMRDGISLSADVYLPLTGRGLPTIVQWTPYESTRERFVAWGVWFASRGYAAVVVDVRGRYESEGVFTAWELDGRDAYDTVTWAAAEQWSNGRIGTWGRSYGGLVQWQLAHLQHPNVQCIAPQVIHDDYFWDGYWTGGAFQLALTLGAAALWTSAMALITGPAARDVVLNDRVFGHLPLIELDEVTIGRKVDYWRLWWEHQVNDDYWQQFRHRPEKVAVPIFQQGGWFDPYSGSHLRSFAAIGSRVPNRVLIGPWSHEEEVDTFTGDIDLSPALTVIREHELAFFDRYLKDVDNGWDERPAAELYVLGADAWRGEPEWPLARAEATPFYLRSGGRLSREEPSADEPGDRYDYDPADPVPTIGGVNSVLTMTQGAQTPIKPGPLDQRPLEQRDDVLVYTSDPVEHDLEVVGPIEMVLYAASSARDTDFLVRLCDVYPDGRSIFLTEGIIRARYRLSSRGGVGRAARARRGGRVPDPLLSGCERLPPWASHAGGRHELELPSFLAEPQHRRGRRHRHPDGGRPTDRAAHGPVSLAHRAAGRPRMNGAGGFPTFEAERQLEAARAAGVEPVPLAGTPSPALPEHVVEAVASVLGRPMTQPPPRGLKALREAYAGELLRSTGRAVDPETEIVVTNGAMHALGICFRSLLRAGDEVVVPSPCFFFEGPIRSAGAVPVYVPGDPDEGWRSDPEAIERALGPRTAALLLCNPGNPTGAVPTREELAAVMALAADRGLLVVTDEAYEAALWDGAALSSAFALGENVIAIRSLGKSLSMPTLRAGIVAGPAAPITACARTLEWDCLRVNLAAQVAAVAALEGPRDWLHAVHAALAADRAVALAAVEVTPGLAAGVPAAAPFLFVHADSGEPVGAGLAAAGLPVVDGIHFQAPGYARLPFAGAARAADELAAALGRWAAAAVP